MLVEDLRGDRSSRRGGAAAATAFAEAWTRRAAPGRSHSKSAYTGCRGRSHDPEPAAGRLAMPADRALLEEWLIAFGMEALNDADAERVRFGLDDWERGGTGATGCGRRTGGRSR